MGEFNNAAFSRRLKALREERGMDQQQLADAVGLSKNMIARYELGSANPSADKVVRMASVLGCTTDVLLCVVPLAVA